MNDLLVVVLCYAGDLSQVLHQMDSYLHHGADVLILSPEDAPAQVHHPRVFNRSAGLSGWKGDHVAHKLIEHVKIMLEYPLNWFLVHESDSLCLEPKLPDYLFERTGVFWNSSLGDPGAPGSNTAPPWFGHRRVFEKFVEVSEQHVDEWNANWSANEGEGLGNSEMFAEALRVGQIPVGAFRDYVWVYRESDPHKLISRVREGASFVTGIKSVEMYRELVRAHEGAA